MTEEEQLNYLKSIFLIKDWASRPFIDYQDLKEEGESLLKEIGELGMGTDTREPDKEGNFPPLTLEEMLKVQDVVDAFYRPIISGLRIEIRRLNGLLKIKNEELDHLRRKR